MKLGTLAGGNSWAFIVDKYGNILNITNNIYIQQIF